MWVRPWLKVAVVLASLTFFASGAQAAILDFEYTATLDQTTTIDGSPLSGTATLSINAPFDTSTGFSFGFGVEAYLALPTITISGIGAITPEPGTPFAVLIGDPVNNTFATGDYLVGLADSFSSGFFSGFTTATPNFSEFAPAPSVFSDYLGSDFAFDLPLAGGGDLVISELAANTSATAEIVPAPEPASLALLASGLVGLGVLRRRKRA